MRLGTQIRETCRWMTDETERTLGERDNDDEGARTKKAVVEDFTGHTHQAAGTFPRPFDMLL